eukprot:Rmarinus@m.16033
MGQQITEISGLSELVSLRFLYLCNNQISKIQGLEGNRKLQRLWLYSNRITVIENLDHLSDLRELWLQDNEIEKVENLQNLVNLQRLNLAANPIANLNNVHHLANLPALYDVSFHDENFGSCRISEIEGYREYVLYHLKQVAVLDGIPVDSNEAQEVEDRFLGAVLDFNSQVEDLKRDNATRYERIDERRRGIDQEFEELQLDLVASLKALGEEMRVGRSDMHDALLRQRQWRGEARRRLAMKLRVLEDEYDKQVAQLIQGERARLEEEEEVYRAAVATLDAAALEVNVITGIGTSTGEIIGHRLDDRSQDFKFFNQWAEVTTETWGQKLKGTTQSPRQCWAYRHMFQAMAKPCSTAALWALHDARAVKAHNLDISLYKKMDRIVYVDYLPRICRVLEEGFTQRPGTKLVFHGDVVHALAWAHTRLRPPKSRQDGATSTRERERRGGSLGENQAELMDSCSTTIAMLMCVVDGSEFPMCKPGEEHNMSESVVGWRVCSCCGGESDASGPSTDGQTTCPGVRYFVDPCRAKVAMTHYLRVEPKRPSPDDGDTLWAHFENLIFAHNWDGKKIASLVKLEAAVEEILRTHQAISWGNSELISSHASEHLPDIGALKDDEEEISRLAHAIRDLESKVSLEKSKQSGLLRSIRSRRPYSPPRSAALADLDVAASAAAAAAGAVGEGGSGGGVGGGGMPSTTHASQTALMSFGAVDKDRGSASARAYVRSTSARSSSSGSHPHTRPASAGASGASYGQYAYGAAAQLYAKRGSGQAGASGSAAAAAAAARAYGTSPVGISPSGPAGAAFRMQYGGAGSGSGPSSGGPITAWERPTSAKSSSRRNVTPQSRSASRDRRTLVGSGSGTSIVNGRPSSATRDHRRISSAHR